MLPFSILDMIRNPGVPSYETSIRRTFKLKEPKPFNFSITIQPDGHILVQDAPVDQNYFKGFRNLYDQFSEDFKRLRHDFVGSLGQMTTDIPFSQIDPSYDENNPETILNWHKLTPDFWTESTRVLSELGTTMSTEDISLERDYDAKWLKYESYLEKAKVNQYFVFIVGQNSVTSNFPLTDDHVTELCMRCRFGIALETAIIEKLGKNPFIDEDNSVKERIVLGVLNSIGRSDSEDVDFNHDQVEFSLEPMTEEEMDKVHITLRREFLMTSHSDRFPRSDVNKYLSGFTPENSHPLYYKKRVTNFPFVIAYRASDTKDVTLKDPPIEQMYLLPDKLRAAWCECFDSDSYIRLPEDDEILIEESEGFVKDEPVKHKLRKHHSFKPKLNQTEEAALASVGIGARTYLWSKDVKSTLEEESHKGFHPQTDVTDIEDFLSGISLTRKYKIDGDLILPQLLKETKSMAQDRNEFINSTDIFREVIYSSEFVCFADLVSNFVQEIILSCKTYTPESSFTFKYLRYYKAGLILRNTGTHIFVSYIFQKSGCSVIDTGRLGPELYDVGDYIVSDWCSYDQVHLEHFMKCGPLMGSLMSHFLALFKLDVTDISKLDLFSLKTHTQFWHSLKMGLLIFLNSKLDAEELITAQRYLTMNILDEVVPDPYRFVKRLPSVLRSRLTCLLTQRTIDIMHYYDETKISKSRVEDITGGKKAVYYNLRSILLPGYISIEMAIEFFYMGYLVSKNRSSGAQSTFSICKKLFSEEFKYLKNRAAGKRVFSDLQTGSDHQADRTIFKFFVQSLGMIMKRLIAPNYQEILSREIVTKMGKTTFLDLATLKASARPWEPDYDIDSIDLDTSFTKVKMQLKKQDPSSFKSRPKAILALSNLMTDYINAKGKAADHIIELVPFCLEKLEVKGGFESDLFSKDQHGGIREITVLEIAARIVQYFVEVISRVICKHFDSETLTSPENKERLIPKHYAEFGVAYPNFITLCTSGDKKTWCQGHHAVRFANMLTGLTHPRFHNLIYRVLRLWVDKRVKLPSDLIAIFLSNEKTASSDEVFVEMRRRFYAGEEPFLAKGSQTARIRSGMFQGLLHYASSVHHTMCQEVISIIQKDMWKTYVDRPIKITVAQGSDDYMALYSIPYAEKIILKQLQLIHRLVKFRNRLTHLTGITDSDKTAKTILDVVEYNSEWTVAKSITRPTLKWAIASLEISLVENFVTRLRQFSNNLTQVLEGGASTLECALIQQCQAWLHYKLLGLDQHYHFFTFKDLLLKTPDPACGFFPLEADLTCGLPGLDYSLYHLAKSTGFGTILVNLETLAEVDNLEYNGRKTKTLGQEARAITLKFSDPKKWKKIVDESGLPDYDECIDYFNANPEVAFSGNLSWDENKMSVALKLYSPGVRSSLSGHQPLLRMMVASSYMLNRPCFMYHVKDQENNMTKKKMTLLQILRKKSDDLFIQRGEEELQKGLQALFPRYKEYDSLRQFEADTNSSMFLESSTFRRRGKVLLEIFPDSSEEAFSLMAMCQRKWFNKRYSVKVGSHLFEALWGKAKAKYSFLRDNVEDTISHTGLNVIQLKFFLEATDTKGRSVKLMDTSAKAQSLHSTITRIFWDTIKIRTYKATMMSSEISDLRSTLFSIINFAYRDTYKVSLIRQLLASSEILKKEAHDLPTSCRALKLLRDIITDSISREMAVLDIIDHKDGAIGWFSIRQKFNPQTGKRIGPGEWRGRLGRISVIISIIDQKVTRVLISSLNDTDQTAILLDKFFKESKLHPQKIADLSPHNFYYKRRTGICRANKPMEESVPILVDPEFRIERFDSIDKTNWEIDCTPFAIRLINIDGFGNKAVLVSERISAKDWDKDSSWPLAIDTPLHYWHKGLPLPMSKWSDLIEEFWSMNHANRNFLSHIRYLRKSSSQGYYDIVRLSILFTRYFTGYSMTDEDKAAFIDVDSRKEVIETNLSDVPLDMIEMLRAFTDPDVAMDEDWSSLPVIEENPDSLGLDDFEYENDLARDSINILSGFSDGADYLPQEILDELGVGMPMGNKFFVTLNTVLSSAYPNIDLEHLLQKDTLFEEPIGSLFSYLSGKDKRADSLYEDDIRFEDSISHQHSSITGVSTTSSITRLQAYIEDLIRDLPGSRGIVYELAMSKLRSARTKLRAAEKVDVTHKVTPDDLLDMNKKKVTLALYDAIANYTVPALPKTSLDTDDDIFWSRILIDLFTHIGESVDSKGLEEQVLQEWILALKLYNPTPAYWAVIADKIQKDISFTYFGEEVAREMYTDTSAEGLERESATYEISTRSWTISLGTFQPEPDSPTTPTPIATISQPEAYTSNLEPPIEEEDEDDFYL
jgi:hypothetical protein